MVSHSVHSRKLPDAITRAGHELIMAEYDETRRTWNIPLRFRGGESLQEVYEGIPTVFWGPHKMVRDHAAQFVPGSFGLVDGARVSHYMTHLPRDWFLNSVNFLTTWGDFQNRHAYWFALCGGSVFIRPDSGTKTFAGQTIARADYEHEVNSLRQLSKMPAETLIWLARVQPLRGEFRFVVANGRVIAGSEYRWDNVLDIRSDYPAECLALAQQVAEHPWQLDRAYTVDVALTPIRDSARRGYEPRVVELNGFSCAGLYACDLDLVVAGISEAAIAEWNELYNI